MRKYMRMLLLGTLFAALLCGSALAAEVTRGVYNVEESGCTLTFATAEDQEIASKPETINGNQENLFVDAVKIGFAPTNTSEDQYLVFVLKGTKTVPTKDNIVYIDQKPGTEASTFELYPSALLKGSYTVCMSTSAADGGTIQKVGSFQYYEQYRWGDANLDGYVKVGDAMAVLKHFVASSSSPDRLGPAAREVADVTHDNKANVQDAMKILRVYGGAIKDKDALAKYGPCIGT